MEAGDRDRRVRIQQRTVTVDASNFPIEGWTTLADVWMSKGDVQGRERFIADQIAAKADGAWEMPYRADMDPELVDVPADRRLQYPIGTGRTYDIVSAQSINRRDGVALTTIASTRAA